MVDFQAISLSLLVQQKYLWVGEEIFLELQMCFPGISALTWPSFYGNLCWPLFVPRYWPTLE